VIRSGEGLRVNTEAVLRVTFRSGNRARDLSGYTVTGQGKLNAGSAFAVTLTEVTDGTDGEYDVAISDTDLTAEGTLALEFTFAGSPVINAPARPLYIPVRAEFEDAP
jgi:hypothetical protein